MVDQRINTSFQIGHPEFLRDAPPVQPPVGCISVGSNLVGAGVDFCVYKIKGHIPLCVVQHIAVLDGGNVVIIDRGYQNQFANVVVVDGHDGTGRMGQLVSGGHVIRVNFKAHSAIPTTSVA